MRRALVPIAKGKHVNHFNKIVGKYFQEKRRDARLSQSFVADKLGYTTPQYISNFERGLCPPSAKAINEMCELYNLNKLDVLAVFSNAQAKEFRQLLKIS